jgi:biopolymer transport protein ExbD
MALRKKRKRRANRAFEDDSNPEFQVAPMADLLFVLLVFFMSITSVEVLRTEKGIELPVAKDSLDNKQKAHQIVINVGWTAGSHVGELKVEDRPYGTPDDLVPLLADRLRRDPVLRVLIRADRDAEYSYIADIMKACSKAQIANVTFAVLNGDKQPAHAAPGS